MKKIIAFKRYYTDFMGELSTMERAKIMRALLLFETEDKFPITILNICVMSYMNLGLLLATTNIDCYLFMTTTPLSCC